MIVVPNKLIRVKVVFHKIDPKTFYMVTFDLISHNVGITILDLFGSVYIFFSNYHD